MKLDILTALNAERAARRAAVVVTDVESGKQRLVKSADLAKDPLRPLLAEHLRTSKSGMEQTAEGRVFLTVYVPAPQLVITGAVHISQALAPIGKLLGYDVTIVDPRTAFASPERFPEVNVVAEWPDTALPPLNVDRYTAFVALTHDPKIDDPALLHALSRDCFYIGALGSRKTHARRLERLKQQGVTDADLLRIHAPIGLDIGAVSPAEIAVAIMAQITERLREEADPLPVPPPPAGEGRVGACARCVARLLRTAHHFWRAPSSCPRRSCPRHRHRKDRQSACEARPIRRSDRRSSRSNRSQPCRTDKAHPRQA
jgi:xanthine dehydrogenase accessory factor